MTTLFTMAILLSVPAEADHIDAKHSPSEAVAVMNALLVKNDFRAFYKAHCHQHMCDQIDEKRFVEHMKGDRGAVIVKLFAGVQNAITEKKGEDVLIAQPQANTNSSL